MAPQNKWFAASPNTDYIFKSLTDGTVTKMTGGRIPQMTPTQAAGLIGSWVIETGRRDLTNLDVVESGSGRGRGLSQYTGVRRTPYDQAASAARAAGKDPNSAQWQLEYFAKEYMNRDLIGWTRVFENMPKNLKSAGEYAKYFTGSAAEGKGYFRPGTPHTDRRMQAAQEVLKHYTNPKPSTPSATPSNKAGPNQFLDGVLNKLGIKGGPQSFNTDKIQSILGDMAANPNVKADVGLAIFASSTKGDVFKKWGSLDASSKKAWRTVGGQLGFQIANTPSPAKTYTMPKATRVGAGEYNPVKQVDLSIGGMRPGDLGYGSSRSTTATKSIAQVHYDANKDYFTKTGKYDQYGGQYGADTTGRYSGTVKNLSGSGWTGGYSGLNIGGYSGSTPSYSSGSVATNTGMGSIGTPGSY
jgi:hypothetical protein